MGTGSDGIWKAWPSRTSIYSEIFPTSWKGREIKIPDGHQIVGFALKLDSKGNIIWVDLKTWRPPRRI
jgi:hypothetical protein